MRKPLIAGNWKLHKTIAQATELVNSLLEKLADVKDVEIVVAPVFTALPSVCRQSQNSAIMVAAQNCYPQTEGAFTGEVSAPLLADCGCRYVILGHSERRQLFDEQDEFINEKVLSVLAAGLRPILCIGETLEQRDSGELFEVIAYQLRFGLAEVTAEQMTDVVIAYEPVWAIGTGKTATSEEAAEVHAYIRGLLQGLFDHEVAEQTRILYGGSVKPGNIGELMAEADIDGALVGGASLNAEDFSAIVHFPKPLRMSNTPLP
ncbi:MAG: triose-phosphate isomerase [Desulfuromonadaceae bacterium]|nr:triose-phosphate isomerase [Desulfuromonadaceae bacterium]